MKTILVPTSGTPTDTPVFQTALALARSAHAHLEFFHLRLDPCEAAIRDPHANFCVGPAIAATLSFLEQRDQAVAADAASHFRHFCETQRVPIVEAPARSDNLSAHWIEETNNPGERLLLHARHCDVTVLGRRHTLDFMPENLIENLMKDSGRPVVIAPDSARHGLLRTIAVAWNETAQSARALGAAMPLLAQAHRVILLTVPEVPETDSRNVEHLAAQLAWSGIRAETRVLPESTHSVGQRLLRAARKAEADLLVAGGYGHNSFREQLFGGVTRELLDETDVPVFLMH